MLNADDFGSRQSANAAIVDGFEHGLLTSTSLMVPCAWAYDAMEWLKLHPDVSFAVHLTLVRDFDCYRWGPVAGAAHVPSLVDGNGHFPLFDGNRELRPTALIDDVEREFQAQIDAVLRFGLRPSHLDWHCLPDGGREDVFRLTERLALEFGLALRVHSAEHQTEGLAAGRPTIDQPMLDSYSIPSATKLEYLHGVLRSLPAGVTEWAVHPALDTPESRAVEPESWQIRHLDHAFVCSDEARQIIADEGIVLISYRELQRVWVESMGAS